MVGAAGFPAGELPSLGWLCLAEVDAETRVVLGKKPPGKVCRLTNADAQVGHDRVTHRRGRETQPTTRWTAAACHGCPVMRPVDAERDGEFARTGAEVLRVGLVAARLHRRQSTARFQRADEDESVAVATFDVEVEEPVHPVVEIDVGGTGRLRFHKLPRTGARRRVAGGIAFDGVGLSLQDDAGAAIPDELDADQIAGHVEHIALKIVATEEGGSHEWD